MNLQHAIAWGIFLLIVLAMLAIDLFLLHRKPRTIHWKEAFVGVAIPVGAAGLFCGAIYWAYNAHFLGLGETAHAMASKYYPANGPDAALLFLTGYVIELSLSADNVFLFVLLMTFFKVPRELQYRVLFWGVLGALVMRGIMILAGAALLARFQWIIYLFGLFLLYAGVKMFFSGEPKDPSDNLAVRLVRKALPIHQGFAGKNFLTRMDGKWMGTTLLLVLICIEFTDLIFALDSIPAIFGITRDPFLVFTSNIFAVLGLRSMYFLLAGIMDKFHLLKYGLAAVLVFVGVKMLLPAGAEVYGHWNGHAPPAWDISQSYSLMVIIVVLGASIAASLLFPCKKRHGNPLEVESAEVSSAK